ncbi:hypothetical protein [Cystobacter fuscus]|uniref:hypothetical protein n=1 Tax=Cystobacter fuscus TaxID=43 RepID=UPI0005B93991|nr:hypothetical protein [Cystobacter fuscus]
MISNLKSRNALSAINAVLVLARSMAHEGRSGDVAAVLDVAEYLPMLMLEPADRTEEFRNQLADLAQRDSAFALALARFDSTE